MTSADRLWLLGAVAIVVQRVLRTSGAVACLLAALLASGGHWLVLQSVAWTRMVVEFAQTDSLAVAVEKTFDGEHPCPMCQKIQRGREKESAPGPLVKWEKLPEGVLDVPCVTVPAPAELESSSVWGAPRPGKGTVHTPPKPPPRLA